LIRAAHGEAPDKALITAINEGLSLSEGPVMAYEDARRQVGKRVRIEDSRITALCLTGETAAHAWLKGLWEEGGAITGGASQELRRWLLAPLSTPPQGATGISCKTLCNCMNISEAAIRGGIAEGLDLNGLKQSLGCGTQCGSCVPEIKRMLNQTAAHA
jgi:assimilatory nitrate reductase catalytic subunit